MAAREQSRQRAVRIPLDYFKSPNRWERARLVALVVVLAAVIAWWTAGMLQGRQEASFNAPGRLASVHQTWESQCAACHAGFHPIRDDGLGAHWEGGTPDADRKCQTCHQGPPHFVRQTVAESPACSSCHREHQGLQASLLRMDDRACTRCHHAAKTGEASEAAAASPIDRFDAASHPKFKSVQRDPGRLRFSHAIHMRAGLGVSAPYTYAAIIQDPVQRARYMAAAGTSDESAPIRLQCNSCHRLDSSDFNWGRTEDVAAASLPARSAGASMLPITFENQCQACHTLDRSELSAKIYHRQPPAEIHAALLAGATDKVLREGKSELLERFIGPAPLPNDRTPLKAEIRQLIDERVSTAEQRITEDICGKCHYFKPADRPGLAPIIPPRVPEVWFEHALFDHRSHRAVDCQLCHEKAASDPGPAADNRHGGASYIPDRDTCLACHAPLERVDGQIRGGARFDCVECHRYHNGKDRMAGVGAQAEAPARPLSVREFHDGEPEAKP